MSGPSFSAPPRRQAAKKAMSSMADQLSDSDTNPDSDSSPYKAPTLNKAAGKVKSKAKTTRPPASGKLRSKAPPASRDGTTTAIGATSTARPASRKRKLEAAGLANSGGDANAHAMDASSPLSSPGSFTFSPPKRRRHCSAHSSETSTSSAPALSTRPGLARFESSSLVLAELFGPSLKGKGKASASGHMDAKGLGKHAFVLLDAEGNVSEEGTVWWPAEVCTIP